MSVDVVILLLKIRMKRENQGESEVTNIYKDGDDNKKESIKRAFCSSIRTERISWGALLVS